MQVLVSRSVRCFDDFKGLMGVLEMNESELDGQNLELKANGSINKQLVKGPIVNHQLDATNTTAVFGVRIENMGVARVEKVTLDGTKYSIGNKHYDLTRDSYKFIVSL